MFCVFVKQDTRDGLGTGKLHGRQTFVCREGFALFVPIEAVTPEEDARSTGTSEGVENVEKQIRKDELQAKSLSCDVSSSGKLPFKFHLKRSILRSRRVPALIMGVFI